MTQTKETVDTLRPEITLSALDTTKVDKSNIIDDFCNSVSIPLKIAGEEKSAFEQVFNDLVFKYVERNGRDDTTNSQSINLDLVVDDNSGKRRYYIGAEIQREDWDGNDPIYVSEKVNLTDKEQAAVELALLKITNPEEYLRKYSRFQIAQLPQIINAKMGFVIDGIRNDDLYASVWLSQDQKTCMLACVERCHNPESKIQLLKIGQ
ncbi:MAG: hypothetical protein LKJ17_10640 [Oscillospiraceae bacterium]|jgi:hypothetical protein|nr:hypothetical protein [Oscillospiraceae bacterium]